jgi:hypothetical protein
VLIFPAELCPGGGALAPTLELKSPNGSDPPKLLKGISPNGSNGSGAVFLDTKLLATEDAPELGGGINPVCGGNAEAMVVFPAKRSTLSCSIISMTTTCINELRNYMIC